MSDNMKIKIFLTLEINVLNMPITNVSLNIYKKHCIYKV